MINPCQSSFENAVFDVRGNFSKNSFFELLQGDKVDNKLKRKWESNGDDKVCNENEKV